MQKLFSSLWLLLLFVSAPCLHADKPFAFATTPGKLPKTIIPVFYALSLQPDLESNTFQGSETIDLQILKATDEIVLNALDLTISNALVETGARLTLRPFLDTNTQLLHLKAPQRLPVGKAKLTLSFTGKLTEQAQGLFYVRYTAPAGKKVMLATQMEPTDARRMFPCWDEPAFRARFQITVTLPQRFKAYSNMSIEHESALPGDLRETKFLPTPSMASYLVALVAGELEEISDVSEGVKLRVITTEGKSERGRYALDAAKKLLPYYNEYFGLDYPLAKLDLIAIPGGFSGAMENWGAITYEENSLLFSTNSSSPETQRDVFITIAHEMSHQWFGNLVTTAWWNDLWLNEGFATWMENKATAHFNPGWQIPLKSENEKSAVMADDSLPGTHAIHQSVANESEANDAFDGITYQKGGAFLQMLESYLGQDQFRAGIHHYLSAHLYSNATTADLWQALQEISGKPVSEIAGGWIEQTGLPVIKVQSDSHHAGVTLRQEPFNSQGSAPFHKSRWQVPISYFDLTTPDDIQHLLLTGKSTNLSFAAWTNGLKLNARDAGYFRSQYGPDLFEKVLPSLAVLDASDQLNFLNDAWAMTDANHLDITNYFRAAECLASSQTFAIWDQLLSSFEYLDLLERTTPNRAAFRHYACRFARPAFDRLGWETLASTTDNSQLLRAHLLAFLGTFGDTNIIAAAHSRFTAFIANPASLAPDLRPAVLKIVGRYADQTVYDQLHDLARRADNSEERQRYYHAMASATNAALAAQTLALALTDELIPQEATALVISVAHRGDQPELAWAFLRQHLAAILQKVDSFERDQYLPSLFESFSDSPHADELEKFVHKNFGAVGYDKAHDAASRIRSSARFKANHLPGVDRWVATKTPQLPIHEDR